MKIFEIYYNGEKYGLIVREDGVEFCCPNCKSINKMPSGSALSFGFKVSYDGLASIDCSVYCMNCKKQYFLRNGILKEIVNKWTLSL